MTRFVLTDSAIRDIEQIWDHIAADSPRNADLLIDTIYREILRIGTSPRIGHRRSDLAGRKSLLFWAVAAYLIVYRSTGAETVILAVLHGSRDVPSVLRGRQQEE